MTTIPKNPSTGALEFRFLCIPKDLVVHPGQTFSIVGFSQVDEWTLVRWRLDFGFDGPNGSYLESETLYKGTEEAATDQLRGDIGLFEVSDKPTQMPQFPASVWDRVDGRIGEYGMPPAIAIALRDVKNWIYLQAPREAPI
jgi:hypothetical protein